MILLTSTPMPFAAVMAFASILVIGSLILSASDAIKTFRRK